MGNCSSTSNCNPCGPDFNAINQLATKAGAYARQANAYAIDSANSAINAENAFLEFNALYLGAFAVAPTVDNEGDPLQTGALYWNSSSNTMFVWDGTIWVAADFNEFTPFLATGTTFARNLVTREADVINVKDFGAVGDGITDDTVAIQAAINQAQLSNTSSVVYIPATQFSYRTTTTLTITRNIKLVGDCILTPVSNTPATKVSKLYFDHLGIGLDIQGGQARGTWVEGLELERKQPAPSTVVPTPWIPAAANFDIVVRDTYSVTITDCLISSATKAIQAFSLGFGQLNVLNCKIWAFDIGIEFDGCYDVCRVDNVHIWPFRLQNTNVYNYTRSNLRGIVTKRNDNPKFSNLFVYAAKYAVEFSGSAFGMTQRAEIVNCGFDFNGEAGIYFSPQSTFNASAVISNTYCHSGEFGIKCESVYNNIQIENFRVTKVNKNAINVSGGSSNNLQITNLFVDEWDRDLANNPAIRCPSGTNNRVFIETRINAKLGGTAPVIDTIGGIDSYEWFQQSAPFEAETGTITSGTCSIFFRKQNETIKFEIEATITDSGTGALGLLITLPYSAANGSIVCGRVLNTADNVTGQINPSSNVLTCKLFDGTSAIATGNIIRITGEYYTGL